MSVTGLRVIHRAYSAAIINDKTEQVIKVYRGKSCHRRAEHDLKMLILGAMIERVGMPKDWKLKPGRKRCSRELCKQPAINGERYCSACKAMVVAEMEEKRYLQPLERDTIRRSGGEFRPETRNGTD